MTATTGPVGGGPATVRLIGDEMLAWSDHARGPVRGRALAAWLSQHASAGRVLLAGPHAVELIANVARARPSPDVSCLVRAHRDAMMLIEVFAGAISVLCGSVAKLSAEQRYDCVVALDGVDRLCSAEGAQLTWAEAVGVLVDVLRPGGTLLLGVANTFGVHELVSLGPPDEVTDSRWSYLGELDGSRPSAPGRLLEAIAELGMRPDRLWVGYPLPGSPALIISDDALDGELVRAGHLSAALSAACAAGFSGTPVMVDPRRLSARAVRGGLGTHLAPLWIVRAHKPPLPPARAATVELASGPQILLADDAVSCPVVCELTIGPDRGWLRRPVDQPAGAAEPAGATGPARAAGLVLCRDPGTLAGPLPAGQSLAELLLAACARRDLTELRLLVSDWVALATDDPFATAENVVVTAAGLRVLDPSWSVHGPVSGPVAVARCLRQFAVTLLAGAYQHPWPSMLTADALTAILVGLAGLTPDRSAIAAAVQLEADVQAAMGGLSEVQRLELAGRLAAVAPTHPPGGIDGLREAWATVAFLRRELAHDRAKMGWYEQLLSSRERALHRSQRTVELISASMSYRIGRWLLAPLRLARRTARRLRARSSQPPR